MQANFTIDQLIDEVRKLANEKPDFVYERPIASGPCSYTKSKTSETEGCIFGQAIFRLQPELKSYLCDCGINTLIQLLEIKASKQEIIWCCRVQGYQDRANSWKLAIEFADEKLS